MKVHHRQIHSMGTRFDLVIAGAEQDQYDHILREVKSELDRIEGMLSIYQTDSVISLLNSMAHAGIIAIDQEVVEIFREIGNYHRETKGYFDITLKPLYDYFRDHDQNLPLDPGIREIVGMDKFVVEPGGVRFLRKGVTLDLGGYGKGYAVKRILPIMESHGVKHALLSFGESLVYGWGTHPHGESWRISIPGDGGGESLFFDLKNEALSTSGNSLNNKKKYANLGHIVNPVSLLMSAQQGLVCVKSSDPVRCEVYSTALFSAGQEKSDEVLKNAGDLEVGWIDKGS